MVAKITSPTTCEAVELLTHVIDWSSVSRIVKGTDEVKGKDKVDELAEQRMLKNQGVRHSFFTEQYGRVMLEQIDVKRLRRTRLFLLTDGSWLVDVKSLTNESLSLTHHCTAELVSTFVQLKLDGKRAVKAISNILTIMIPLPIHPEISWEDLKYQVCQWLKSVNAGVTAA